MKALPSSFAVMARRPMQAESPRLPYLLGFLAAVGPLSTDMYLPAFPAIEAEFGVGTGTAQVTLASWFAGLAIGQLSQGTLSDRFGRRGPLLIGLALYTLASIGCALAPSLGILTVLRGVAAFGGSASMVLPRAVVRDLATGNRAAWLMSQLMLVMGAAPILAPGLGGLLLGFSYWQAIFWFAALHGSVSMFLVWRLLPETLPAQRRVRSGLLGLLIRYGNVLRDRTFAVNASIGSFAMFGLFAYISGSPPVYIGHYGLSATACGALIGTCSAGFIFGSQANPWLLKRFSIAAVLRAALRTFLVAALFLAFFAFTGRYGLWSVAVPILVATTAMGTAMPNAAVAALMRQGANAGSASALIGTGQFALAAVAGALVGHFTDGTARPMAALVLTGAACAVLVDLFQPKLPFTPSGR